MARRPFFGQNDTKIAKMDMQAATAPGRAYAAAFKGLGEDIGGAIEKYQLNKEKQKKNEGFIKSQSGMLDMLAEQDPEMASKYAAMKEQLNNPDVPLATRAEFGKNLVNNITLSTQLKGQRLLQDTQAQTLKEKKETEDLRKSLLQQKEKYNNLGIELQQLALTEDKELSAAKIKNTLARYGLSNSQIEAEKEILPGQTAAQKATNELTTETAKASIKLLPSQTADKEGELAARSRERKIVDEVIDQSGGIEGTARKRVEATDLKTEATKQDIENKKVLASYYQDVGLAKKLEAVGKLNPSLKQQLDPLTKMQGDLLSTKVAVPGEGQTRITLSEYLELNKEDDTKYPLNGIAGLLYGELQNVDKQMEGALSKQLVDVYVPDKEEQKQPFNYTDMGGTQTLQTFPRL